MNKFDYLDFEIIANLIYFLIDNQQYNEALEFVTLIESLYDEVSTEILVNFMVIYHLELNIYIHTKDANNVIKQAKIMIDFANKEELKHHPSNLLGDTGLEIIRQIAENIINPKVRQVAPIRVEKSFRRNDIVRVRYKDGTIVEKKYKKIENDIRSGECFILTDK
ncbi:MAG: hypothetical protein IPL12_02070 [Bacteroidetes bacterium]|nr:hypothetical protein [Bacteroidota bacterium]